MVNRLKNHSLSHPIRGQYNQAYESSKPIGVGNGSTIHIQSHGFSVLKPSNRESLLQLCDVLYPPNGFSNIVSINKLYKDNDAIVEFHSHEFFVKDTKSKEILSQGIANGVYTLSKIKFNSLFLTYLSCLLLVIQISFLF